MHGRVLALVVPLVVSSLAVAEERPTDAYLDQTRDRWTAVARKIWETPEIALQEKKSAQALAEVLQKEGFKVTWGVGGEPTAFVATAGTGAPTIAFLAEYDALPSLSQKAGTATRSAVVENGPGHGCGHNLLGTAATAAAVAANRERQSRKLAGDHPAVRDAGGGGAVRQDVHDPGRRLQVHRCGPRLAPGRPEPGGEPGPARGRGVGGRVLRSFGACRRRALGRTERARCPDALRPRDGADAGARQADGPHPPRHPGGRGRGERHPGPHPGGVLGP